jgi:ubiquinone/menaquinone biosynthesis C-methylase UbiE
MKMKEKIRQFYQDWWIRKSSVESMLDPRKRKILELIEQYPGGNLLDIGCGDGSFTVLLGQKTLFNLYGIDISPIAVESARTKGIKAILYNVEDGIPFENSSFDCIFCGELIEHIFDTDALLDEIYRVLKPRGIFILTTPNLASWFDRVALFCGYQPACCEVSLNMPGTLIYNAKKDKPAGHIRAFTLRALKELVIFHGFTVERILGSSKPVVRYGKLIDVLNRIFSTYAPLSGFLILKLRKAGRENSKCEEHL